MEDIKNNKINSQVDIPQNYKYLIYCGLLNNLQEGIEQ